MSSDHSFTSTRIRFMNYHVCVFERHAAESNSNRNSGIYRRRHRCLSHHRETMTTPGKPSAHTAEKHCRTRPTNIEAIQHGVYQKIISCYTHEDRRKGRGMMAELIESLAVKGGAPGCPELLQRDAHTSQFAVHARPVGLLVGTLDRTPAGKQQGIHLVIGFCPPHHRRRHRAGRRRRTH